MGTETPYVIAYITVPSLEVGRTLARVLVEQKAAACVNIVPGLTSIYAWEGQIHEEEELLLIVKSRRELLEERLLPIVKAHHPYDLPELVALPIVAGHQPYLDWIGKETTADQ